jgi:sugar phosphate isomerase/epimerase
MKFGFSSLGCPDWDLETIITQAAGLGYQAVELRGLQGQLHLPASPEVARDPAGLAARFRDAGVELACLATGNCFHWPDRRKIAEHKAQVREFIELAGEMGCPYVRVFGDEVPRYEQKQTTIMRVVDALRELGPVAAAHGVTLVLENHGDFSGSRDIWFILDAVNHPAVRCCWHPCHAKAAGERPGTSLPRLGRMIALTHLVDGRFNEQGALETYALPGEGNLDVERFLDLLRGLAYQGHVIFDWPKLWVPSLAEPEKAFPAAISKLKAMLEALEGAKELTAYKGDKNVPQFAPPPRRPAVRA